MALQHSKLSQITEITLDLHFDNLQSFFVPVDQVANARAAVTNRLSSKKFGPGFYISAVRNVPKSNTPQLGLYVRSEEGLPTISVNFSYAWQAISGHTYPWSPQTKLQTVTGGGEGRGIASILLRGSQAFQALVMGDNKGICRISMTYDMKDLAVSSSSLDILHSTLVRRMQVDTSKIKIVELIANKRREANDGSHVVEPKILSIVTKAVLEAAGCSWDEFVQRGIDASLWYPVNAGSLRAQDPLGRFDHDSDAEDAVVIALDEGPRNPGPSVPGARVNEIKMEPVDDPDEIRVTPLPEDEATQVAPEEEESPAKLRLFRANPTTMEAVLYWVTTGRISFKPLRKAARGVPADAANRHRPAPASCKSVYRIARILGFKALETIALTYYEAQLSKSDTNVLDELFGPMAAQYVDLKNLALLAVVKRWDQLKNSPALAQKMTEITSGRFPSAGQIMAELWAKVSAVAEKAPAVRELEPEEMSPVAPMRMAVGRRSVRRRLGGFPSLEGSP